MSQKMRVTGRHPNQHLWIRSKRLVIEELQGMIESADYTDTLLFGKISELIAEHHTKKSINYIEEDEQTKVPLSMRPILY